MAPNVVRTVAPACIDNEVRGRNLSGVRGRWHFPFVGGVVAAAHCAGGLRAKLRSLPVIVGTLGTPRGIRFGVRTNPPSSSFSACSSNVRRK